MDQPSVDPGRGDAFGAALLDALSGDWFDWLLMSPDELAAIAAPAGWRLDDVTEPDPYYLAVLRPA
jgi:hypothetical protein